MKTIEGKLVAEGQRIGIVASRFNDFIVSHLITGAEDCFVRHGGDTDNLTLAYVPGAFEIRRRRWRNQANMTPWYASER